MSDLRELYQEVILDHNKNPRNFREIEPASHSGNGFNPLCGDRVHLYVQVDGDRVTDVSFKGSGCAISTASASMLTDAIKGRPIDEAKDIFLRFQRLVIGEASPEDVEQLGKLAVFGGICDFPTRVKCATLAWHTLTSALEGNGDVKTE